MKRKLSYIFITILFVSCSKEENLLDIYVDDFENTYNSQDSTIIIPEANYSFNLDGRCFLDDNNFYHLELINEYQTLHRIGAHVTNQDIYNLPTMIIWTSDSYWTYIDDFNIEHTVPLLNGTSYADPQMDSAYCMIAPVLSMLGDTITIKAEAWFEEGDIILEDSMMFVFN